jgi:hypothetical protein
MATIMLVLTGCGDGGPPSGSVSGNVTYKGKPVTEGVVLFGSKNGPGAAQIESDGSYYAPRVGIGDNDVTVQPLPAASAKKQNVAPPFPVKYTKTGTLKFHVKSGSNRFDVNLQ